MTWSGGLNKFSMPKQRHIIERMAPVFAIQKLRISEGLEIEEISQVLNTLPKRLLYEVFSTSERERNSIGLWSILLRLCRAPVERSGRFILCSFQESIQHVSVITSIN